jgi:hypothetical protein
MASEDLTGDVEKFKEALGPELDYLADGLAPAVAKLVSDVATATVSRTVAPLIDRAAQAETDTVMAAFTEKHPDWQKHEAAMLSLSKKIEPTEGMNELEFLDHLYSRATHDTLEKEVDAKVADGVKAALAATDRASSPRSVRDCYLAAQRGERFDADESVEATTREIVRPTAHSGPSSIRDAFLAAKRGERWE